MIIPAKDEFTKLAEQGNLIPVCYEVLADMETPVSAYRKIAYGAGDQPLPYSFLLESVEGGENIARYSFLAADPFAVFIHRDGQGELQVKGRDPEQINGKDVFAEIHQVLERYKPVEIPGLPPFVGGAVGYASYDVISEVETTVPQPEMKPVDVPEALFMITDTILAFDRVRHTIKIIALAHLEDGDTPERAYEIACAKIENLVGKLQKPIALPPVDLADLPDDLEMTFYGSFTYILPSVPFRGAQQQMNMIRGNNI